MTGVKIQETTNEIAKKALLDLDIFDEENDFQNAKQIFFAINSSIQRHHEVLYHEKVLNDQKDKDEEEQQNLEVETITSAKPIERKLDPIKDERIDGSDESNLISADPTEGLQNIPFHEALNHFRKRFELKQHQFLYQKKSTRTLEVSAEIIHDNDDIIDHKIDSEDTCDQLKERNIAETNNTHDAPSTPVSRKTMEPSPLRDPVIFKAEVETQTTLLSPPPAPSIQSKSNQVHLVDSAIDPVEELLLLPPTLTTTSVSSSSPNHTPISWLSDVSPIQIEIPPLPSTSKLSCLPVSTKRSEVYAFDFSNCSSSEVNSEDEKMNSGPSFVDSVLQKKGPSVIDIPASFTSNPQIEDDFQLETKLQNSTELSKESIEHRSDSISPRSASSSSINDKAPASPPLSSSSSSSLSLSCYDMSKELWENIRARQHRRKQGDQLKLLNIKTTEAQVQTEKQTSTTIATSPMALDVSVYKGSPILSASTNSYSREIEWELDLSNFNI